MTFLPKINYKEYVAGSQDYLRKRAALFVKDCDVIRRKLRNIPDTNFDLGIMHLRKGHLSDACFRFRLVTLFMPNHAEAYFYWARCLLMSGEKELARKRLAQAYELKKSFPEGEFIRKKIESPELIKEIPAFFIEERAAVLIDDYGNPEEVVDSPKLSQKKKELREDLVKTLLANVTDQTPFWDVLDLGCSEGVCGRFLKDKGVVRSMTGVEVSVPKAQRVAAMKLNGESVYNTVVTKEARAFFKEYERKVHLIIATSIFDAFGDISPVIELMKKHLNEKGIVVFVNRTEPLANYLLDVKWDVFSHSDAYITKSFEAAGFALVQNKEVKLPMDASGSIFIFRLT